MNATFRAAVLIIFAVVCAMAWTIIALQPIPNDPKEILLSVLGALIFAALAWAVIEIVVVMRSGK